MSTNNLEPRSSHFTTSTYNSQVMLTLMHDDYTVGWICALPIELTAAMAMLDEQHQPLPQARTDDNSYTLGRIGKHNVAIACLPAGKTGIHPAAIVATHMSHSFRSIRFGLMVGIGGGVPSAENDIRLGDVVVSKPGSKNGGVVQYDFGKTIEEGRFIQTGSLNRPPTALLTALTKLQANHDFGKCGYLQYLSDIPAVVRPKFSYLGAGNDQLFEANYDHVGNNATCANCDVERLQKREPRGSPNARIFYGTIACGNQVMRQGATRDRIAKEFDGLCFEMEAAGLMDAFPCVVIRGICDYADSHKNKQWQPYAAVAAAAYAKELLDVIPPEQVIQTVPIQSPSLGNTVSTLSSSVPPSMRSAPQQHSSGLEKDASAPRLSSTETLANSFFVLNRKILQSSSVALGRLVINTQCPWEDYCPESAKPSDDDIGISPEPRFRGILERSRATPLYTTLVSLFSSLLNVEDALGATGSMLEKSYLLSNSGNWFQKACTTPGTRHWIETIIKSGWDIYMVVGIHTVCRSSTLPVDTENKARQEGFSAGAEPRPVPSANQEVIVAVQYRKVMFQWFWSRNVGHSFLEIGGNRWEPLIITKISEAVDGDGDEDIIEATLQDALVEEDVKEQGDVHIVDHQFLIVWL